jgi:hypothetical protein
LARNHTERALSVLAGIMDEPQSGATARVAAANSLLDRGWGKAAQVIAGDDENGPVQHKLEISWPSKK